MRLLKFQLYDQGCGGFFNELMSLELGVALSVVTERLLLLDELRFPIYNSEKGLNLFDLVDVSFPCAVGDFGAVRGVALPELHGARFNPGDLRAFDHAPTVETCNDQTLGYYSYALPPESRVVYACNRLIAIKEIYRRVAMEIVGHLLRDNGPYASVHVRRATFVGWQPEVGSVGMHEILHNIQCHVPEGCPLLIHSDEREASYFQPIFDAYPNHCLIDDWLLRQFHPRRFDTAEIGVISALIASQSDFFVGTMFSTFTGHIQRWRLLNGKGGGFLYLYNQRPEGVPFQDGRILERPGPEPTWERIDMSDELKSICFWWREWPESVAGAGDGL